MVGRIWFLLGRGRGTGDKNSRSVAILLPYCKAVYGYVWGRIISVAPAICHLRDLDALCRLPLSHANISRPKRGARVCSSVQLHRAAYMVFAGCPALRIGVILNAPFVSILSSFFTVARDTKRHSLCADDSAAD